MIRRYIILPLVMVIWPLWFLHILGVPPFELLEAIAVEGHHYLMLLLE